MSKPTETSTPDSMTAARTYCIRRWSEVFENSQSRQYQRLTWTPLPNKHDGKSYRRLISMADGPALYGAWVLLVQVASKCPQRGVLADQDGPLDAEDLSHKTGCPAEVFAKAFEVLTNPKIAWLEVVSLSADQQHTNSGPTVALGNMPLNRTEENRTEEEKENAADAAGSLAEKSSKTKRPPKPQPQLVPELETLITAWNELPTGIAPRCARRSTTLVAAFGRANGQPEVQNALSDVAKLMATIREGSFLHGQNWFKFHWLFGKDRAGEWNACKIIEGNYRDRANSNRPSPAKWQGDCNDFAHLATNAPAAASGSAGGELDARTA